jgi:hypothetical protein
MMFLWVVTPCRLVGRHQRFEETHCLLLQGWSCCAGKWKVCMGSEEGQAGIWLRDYTASQLRTTTSSSPPWEPQISQTGNLFPCPSIHSIWYSCTGTHSSMKCLTLQYIRLVMAVWHPVASRRRQLHRANHTPNCRKGKLCIEFKCG